MILTCEKCNKRYFVRDEEIVPHGRKVRCVVCQHTWFQAPLETMVPIKLDPEDIPAHPRAVNESAPPRFSFGWLVFIAMVLLIFGGAYFGRHVLVQYWPPIAAVYETLGLEIAMPGAGLKVENIQPTHSEDKGKTMLVVRGEVVNTSTGVAVLPPLNIQLMGPCEGDASKQCVVKEWQYHFSESRLLPGERIAFETEPHETNPGVKNFRVQF